MKRYAAAKTVRTNANWSVVPTGANYNMRATLAILRARARQGSRDNGHFKKFLSLTRSNIIGPAGIQLQANARGMDGKLNVVVNRKVEEAFRLWTMRETCTVSGRLDWLGVQRLVVTQLARDGEFLIETVAADNPFGFSLRVWDVNWLDETYSDTLPNGNRVIMSIEVNDDNRPIAYWLTTPASEINYTNRRSRTRTRVPAENIIHGFLTFDDESQVRGVTWFAAALIDAKNLQGYREGVILSARAAANTFAVITSEAGDDEPYDGADDDEGNPMVPEIDVSPLGVTYLRDGQKMEQFDPKQPTQNHSAFVKSIETDLAAALDVPYFLLSGDMEAVNFSSSRVGLDDARDIWRGLQDFMSTTLCRPVFHRWAREAFLSGKLKLSARDFAQIQNPEWRPRGWKYIDPTKDISADVDRLRNRLTTPSQILAEQGIDYVTHLERWKADKDLALEYDIDIDEIYQEKTAQPAQSPAQDAPPDPPADPPKRALLNGLDRDEMVN